MQESLARAWLGSVSPYSQDTEMGTCTPHCSQRGLSPKPCLAQGIFGSAEPPNLCYTDRGMDEHPKVLWSSPQQGQDVSLQELAKILPGWRRG